MYSLNNKTASFLTVLLIVLSIIFIHVNNQNDKLKKYDDIIDLYKSKVYTKKEIIDIIKQNQTKKLTVQSLYKQFVSGAIRGILIGYLINGQEGAILGGLILGSMNPIISMFETKI